MTRPLHMIADEIYKEWPNVHYSAIPYLGAMRRLESIHDNYGWESGKSVVLYFLENAKSWRGDSARRIKAELRGMLK